MNRSSTCVEQRPGAPLRDDGDQLIAFVRGRIDGQRLVQQLFEFSAVLRRSRHIHRQRRHRDPAIALSATRRHGRSAARARASEPPKASPSLSIVIMSSWSEPLLQPSSSTSARSTIARTIGRSTTRSVRPLASEIAAPRDAADQYSSGTSSFLARRKRRHRVGLQAVGHSFGEPHLERAPAITAGPQVQLERLIAQRLRLFVLIAAEQVGISVDEPIRIRGESAARGDQQRPMVRDRFEERFERFQPEGERRADELGVVVSGKGVTWFRQGIRDRLDRERLDRAGGAHRGHCHQCGEWPRRERGQRRFRANGSGSTDEHRLDRARLVASGSCAGWRGTRAASGSQAAASRPRPGFSCSRVRS